jgi:uncharacterized protein (DUF1330 family)
MKAFVVAAETIRDDAVFAAYRKQVPATLEAFGGRFVARGGEWPHSRLVIIEFPSRAAAEAWYKSDEYQKIIGLRHDSSIGNLIIVDAHID